MACDKNSILELSRLPHLFTGMNQALIILYIGANMRLCFLVFRSDRFVLQPKQGDPRERALLDMLYRI